MAKKHPRIIKKTEEKPASFVINQINQVSVDRTMKDVRSLREALKAAESIFYPNRTRLYDLYSDVLLDGHLTGVIGKRIAGVLNKPIRFQRNKKVADDFSKLIKSKPFRDVVKGIMMSLFWGVSGMEFLPGKTFNFKEVPRKHIKPEKGVITISQSDQEGLIYENAENVFVVGEERDLGLLLQCSFYALIKKGTFGDWAQYIEIFGQPIRVIRYDAYDEKTKIELKQVMDEAGSSLCLMIPKTAEFEILDGKSSNGDGKLQESLKNACNNEMSVVILGNTETTSNDNGGSNAKAKEQGDQQLEITKDDIQFVLNMLNSEKFLAILQSYGYQVEGGEFTVEKQISLNELTLRKDIDIAVSKVVPVADDYFYETYGIPKPANYDELKSQMEARADAALMPKTGDLPGKPGSGKPKDPKAGKPDKKAKLSGWQEFKLKISDFFDQAPRS